MNTQSTKKVRLCIASIIGMAALFVAFQMPAYGHDGHDSDPTVAKITERDHLVAAQEALLNAYRCLFEVDTEIVPGGCKDNAPVRPAAQPSGFRETPTTDDISLRDHLIDDQKALLSAYRGHASIADIMAVDDRYLPAREAEVQDWVADCMSDAGFEYIPWVDQRNSRTDSSSDTPITDAFERNSLESAENVNPNSEIYDNLSQPQQAKYFERLWGKEEVVEGDLPSGDVSRFGCYNAAWVVLYGQETVSARWTALGASLELNEQVQSHPDYIMEEKNWARCMKGKGFTVRQTSDIDKIILNEIESNEDTNLDKIRTFERKVRAANDACDDNLDAVKIRLERELISDSLQNSIDVIVKDIAERQNSS